MTTHATTAFGALLRRYRLAAGLSQEALSERARLSSSAVAALEAGRRTAPRPGTVALLADALALSSVDRTALLAAAAPPDHLGTATAVHPSHPALPMAALPALPLPPTTLIGREREEAAVAHLLLKDEGHGLVTLTGPGGVGKTRLALAVASAVRPAYPDGVAFVDLSPLHDAELVALAVAQALGLREDGGRGVRDVLRVFLGQRKLLLALDNFEQVVEAAPFVAELIAACPHLAVLVTSRTALRVRAEQRFAVSPLAVPAPGEPSVEEVATYAAVRLFVTRARAGRPQFALDAANVAAVAEICRRLDGLPLAIELAAARVALLPPADLLKRLEGRLGVLTRGARDMPARQQTLRAAIDWSHALLTADEQMLFRRASVFVGGGTLEDIEVICAVDGAHDVLGDMASLVDKSLLHMESGDEPRVRMLETLRDYASERLEAAGETTRLRQAHAVYYLALAEAAEPELRGAAQAMWLKRLETEHGNLRAALQWTLRHGDAALSLRLGAALWRFWYIHGHVSEGRGWLTRVLELPDVDARGNVARARAQALEGAGVFTELQGDYAGARALHEESLAIRRSEGDTWGVAASLNDLGVVADSQGDFAQVATYYTQALALFRELGDAWGTAVALSNMGYLACEQGAYGRAAALHEQSLVLFREVGDQRHIAFTLNNLGEALCNQGDCTRATVLCEESLALRRALGDTWGMAISIGSLGNVAHIQGAYARAIALYEESLGLFRDLGATWNTACILDSLSNVARKQGAYARAAALSEESLALFREIHDAKGIARALTSAGQAARAQGDSPRADRLCHESLALYRANGALFGATRCLESLAEGLCAATEGVSADTVERGVRIWGAVASLRDRMGTPRPPADLAAYDHSIATARMALGAQVFDKAWARGAALSLEQAIAEAMQQGTITTNSSGG